jgi:hypothetical protein
MLVTVARITTEGWFDLDGNGVQEGMETFLVNVLAFGAVLALLGLFITLSSRLRAPFVKFGRMINDWNGHPGDEAAGHPEQPGVMRQIVVLHENQEEIKATVDNLDTKVDRVEEEQASAKALFQRGSDRMAAQDEQIATIVHEVAFNNGGSVKDAVTFAGRDAKAALKEVRQIKRALEAKGIIEPAPTRKAVAKKATPVRKAAKKTP